MKNYPKYLLVLFCIGILSACQSDKGPALKPLDLLSYGFPITVMAPDSADVDASSIGTIKEFAIEELTIKGKGNYGLLVQSSIVTITDEKATKANELEMVKDGRYFSKIIKDDEKGFLYETVIDSTHFNYEFFHVKIQGDKEFIFRTPYDHSYTEAEVTKVYDSLASQK